MIASVAKDEDTAIPPNVTPDIREKGKKSRFKPTFVGLPFIPKTENRTRIGQTRALSGRESVRQRVMMASAAKDEDTVIPPNLTPDIREQGKDS
jgi:hypothetical protein